MSLDDLIAAEDAYDQIDLLVEIDPLTLRDLLAEAVVRLSSGKGGAS